MSIAVPLDQLPSAIAERSFAYVVSSNDEGDTHVLAVSVVADGDRLVMDVGGSTSRNVSRRPQITLVFPPSGSGDNSDHTLLVDGTAVVGEGRLEMTPTWAVLHRPAPPFSG